MNKMRAVAIGILASGALACGVLAVAQQTQKQRSPWAGDVSGLSLTETSRESRLVGLDVVRAINGAEARYKYLNGSYATWLTLFRSGGMNNGHILLGWNLREKQFGRMELSIGPEVVPGWTLSLVTAGKGESYELSLRNLGDPCAFSFFSDQHGIIYQGGVIDCSVDVRPRS
jgi:hypothetical protein